MNLFVIICHEITIFDNFLFLLFSVSVWFKKNKSLSDRVAHVNFVCLYWEKEYEKSVKLSQLPISKIGIKS